MQYTQKIEISDIRASICSRLSTSVLCIRIVYIAKHSDCIHFWLAYAFVFYFSFTSFAYFLGYKLKHSEPSVFIHALG